MTDPRADAERALMAAVDAIEDYPDVTSKSWQKSVVLEKYRAGIVAELRACGYQPDGTPQPEPAGSLYARIRELEVTDAHE